VYQNGNEKGNSMKEQDKDPDIDWTRNEQHKTQNSLDAFQQLCQVIDEEDKEISSMINGAELEDWKFLKKILSTFQSINQSLELEEVLEHVMDAAISVIQADRGFLVLRGENGKLVFKIARDSTKQTLKSNEFKVSLSYLQEAIKKKRIVTLVDVGAEEDYVPTQSVEQLNLRSVVCCPLYNGSELIGAIYADSRSPLMGKSHLKLQLFELFSEQASNAINNAQRFAKVKASFLQLERRRKAS